MISILNVIRPISNWLASCAVLTIAFTALPVFAQEAITLSVSPTIYDMAAEPGQVWSSTLKVVNVNDFDLTVYAEVVNFAPRGEGGEGRFISVDEADRTGATLAEWFSIGSEPITIAPERTVEIPFTVKVPADASPGGHFAAIMVGTRPIDKSDGQIKVQTAQVVTSLFFVRVAGDIKETGSIREFSTIRSFFGAPEVTFMLRFENKGNVHLRPQGEIKIFNMWGEERGIVPVNQFLNFGNVLPESIRKFMFTWKGEWSIADIGRYKAIATLAYGSDEIQFSSAETAFWVLPIKLIVFLVIGLALFFLTITWLIRLYVRHMLTLAGVNIEQYTAVKQRSKTIRQLGIHTPVQAGILDLSQRIRHTTSWTERVSTLASFINKYKLFFGGVILVCGFGFLLWWYVTNATIDYRPYEVTYLQSETSPGTQLTSEEIIYDRLRDDLGEVKDQVDESLPEVSIVNRSGVAGLGAKARLHLESAGYKVVSLGADFSNPQVRTVLIAKDELYQSALPISRLIGQAPVSVYQGEAESAPITVFVGEDMSTLVP